MRRVCCTLLLLLVCGAVAAQEAALRGRVTDAETGQALTGATIVVERDGFRGGAAADANGFFVVPRLQTGRYAVHVSFVGYASVRDSVTIEETGRVVAYALQSTSHEAEEVVVEAAPEPVASSGRLARVRPADVRGVPALTPASDLGSYLSTLPAFIATGDRGGQVSVRGGEPAQNLFLLDGIPVYQPFHVLGELSVVPGDVLAVADVYAGAFPARYGGRIASAVDVTLRSGDKRRYHASVSAAPLLSAVHLEGPLVPDKVSAIVSARTSLADRMGAGLTGEPLPFRFSDGLARVHAFLSRTSSFSATAFASRDRATLPTALGVDGQTYWRSEGAGARFVYLPLTFAVLAEMEVFFTRLDSRFSAADQPARRSLVEEGGGNFGFRYLMGESEVHFGVQARTDHLVSEGVRREEEYLTEGAFYVDAIFRRGALRVDPGVRLATFPSRARMHAEPRLRVEWQRRAHLLHAGAAVVHQEIGGRYTSDDLSDVFVTWTPVPEGRALPEARQLVVGWSGTARQSQASLDVYYRALSGLGDTGSLSGHARGVEWSLLHRRGLLEGRLSGALASVRYALPGEAAYPPPPDRPLRLDAQIRAQHAGWEASARWFFVSGAAFTPLRGAYRQVTVQAGLGFLTEPGRLVSADGAPGSRRLPATHRLDLSLGYTATLGGVRVALQAAVRNAYDRANLFYLNRLTGDRYDGLPRTVSVGIRLEV